jgi:GNAT superfamily N-acetyltransferase
MPPALTYWASAVVPIGNHSVGRTLFALHRAVPSQADVILELFTEATEWLREKNTDQWAKPWPNARMRYEHLLHDIVGGKTWMVSNDDTIIGTITVDKEAPVDFSSNYIWPPELRAESALYVRRTIVRRSHAGLGIRARLLDWATSVATRELGTALLRIDVWTDDRELHAYYERQGFTLCEIRDPAELPDYPARALFERRINPNDNSRVGVVLIDSAVRTEVPVPRLPL